MRVPTLSKPVRLILKKKTTTTLFMVTNFNVKVFSYSCVLLALVKPHKQCEYMCVREWTRVNPSVLPLDKANWV